MKVLVVNPGSTSTKIAVLEDEMFLMDKTLRHSAEEIGQYDSIVDQLDFRKNLILDALKEFNIEISSLDAISARGGVLMPIQGGTYAINDLLLEHCRVGVAGQHPANLAAIIANDIAKEVNIPTFIVDPPVMDELQDIARVTGFKGIERKSKFHALNQRAVGRRVAEKIGKKYDECNVIVAHLGGGISIGAHEKGIIVDVNDCYDGEGPITPERSGTIPSGALAKMCFSGEYTLPEIQKMLTGKGGLVSLLGTNDARLVSEKVKEGDKESKLYYEAMCYQISKAIGSCSCVLNGRVDAIAITGGIAYDEMVIEWIKKRVSFIAPVIVFPGEFEMNALAEGAIRVLKNEEIVKEYKL